MANWTADGDRRLLMAVIAAQPTKSWNHERIALHHGEGITTNAVDHRLRILKKEITAMTDAVKNGQAAPVPKPSPRKPSAVKTEGEKKQTKKGTPNKITKTTGRVGGKAAKKSKRALTPDDDGSEAETEIMGDGKSEGEVSMTDLTDDEGSLESDEQVTTPATESPTRRMPARGDKPRTGRFKVEATPEIDDEEDFGEYN